MSIEGSKGATYSIKNFPSDKPNEDIGVCHALDGNQINELENRVIKITNMCNAAVGIHLSQREAAITLNWRISPQTTYVMCLSRFAESQCHKLEK